MARYDVARQTINNAFDILRSEGLTVSRPGAGVFVRERPTVRRVARNRLSRESRAAGRGAFLADAVGSFEPSVETTVRTEPADDRTAAALDIEPGTEVLVRDRVMSADGVPVQLATSRLPRTITAGTRLEEVDTGPSGSYGVLEETGHRLDHYVEYVASRAATADEGDRLQIPAGAPILTVTRLAFDVAGLPVEINSMVLTGERYELVYEIDAD
jgi:GntR family transcriptional regulator